MPRLLRLNEKTQRPNPCINFIKPLPGPDYETAHDFLSRVVAISLPITTGNSLTVMTVEEHEPNREFMGRNFNAGECIQLVLKSLSTGQWLPFRTVQMVFMHELAHNIEMNHSRAFWAVRNKYCEQLKELWAKGYTGDGLWGRGRGLYDGQIGEVSVPEADRNGVAGLCGGTYRGVRRRGKKRGRAVGNGEKETYAEAKQRRIRKKFGEGGLALGGDEDRRVGLEGRLSSTKPRVAKSKRGRELRAAAALARFDKAAAETRVETEGEDEGEFYSWDESDGEGGDTGVLAKDAGGRDIRDNAGNRLVRVCEGENTDVELDAWREMEELSVLHEDVSPTAVSDKGVQSSSPRDQYDVIGTRIKVEDGDEDDKWLQEPKSPVVRPTTTLQHKLNGDNHSINPNIKHESAVSSLPRSTTPSNSSSVATAPAPGSHNRPSSVQDAAITPPDEVSNTTIEPTACPICSLENTMHALTCTACAHALHPDVLPNHWSCTSDSCKESSYLNSGDVGICGLCGSRRP